MSAPEYIVRRPMRILGALRRIVATRIGKALGHQCADRCAYDHTGAMCHARCSHGRTRSTHVGARNMPECDSHSALRALAYWLVRMLNGVVYCAAGANATHARIAKAMVTHMPALAGKMRYGCAGHGLCAPGIPRMYYAYGSAIKSGRNPSRISFAYMQILFAFCSFLACINDMHIVYFRSSAKANMFLFPPKMVKHCLAEHC